MYNVVGGNIFGQWFSEEAVIDNFQAITQNSELIKDINQAELVHMNWSYNIFKVRGEYFVSGFWFGKENQLVKINLPEECDDCLLIGNDYNLIIVDRNLKSLWTMDLKADNCNGIKKVGFHTSMPLLDESATKRLKRDDQVLKVVATNHSLVCLTVSGAVYSGLVPSFMDTSHCYGQVCDVQCGYEHFVLLTDAGRVYTWGNGRRLQLGHGNLDNLDLPTEVEALSGIKIVKIRAGGWHTLALSEYGDLYVWGWNDTGQLGIKEDMETIKGVLKKDGMKSYHFPTFVELYNEEGEQVTLNVIDISCGSRHSALLLEDNTVWTSGYNKYGQLGFNPEISQGVNYFKQAYKCKENVKLRCGPWSTILVKAKK